MISEARLRANRLNAQKSTGPRTPQGKAVSARNATKHGVFAKQVLLDAENPAGLHALQDELIARYEPIDEVEMGFLEEMAACTWRLRRAWAIERQMMKSAMEAQSERTPIERLA